MNWKLLIIALTVLSSVACLEVSPQTLCSTDSDCFEGWLMMPPTRVHVCALASHRRTLNALVAKLALPQRLMAIPASVNQRLRIVTTHLECSQSRSVCCLVVRLHQNQRVNLEHGLEDGRCHVKILVVDDSGGMRDHIRRLKRQTQVNTVEAENCGGPQEGPYRET